MGTVTSTLNAVRHVYTLCAIVIGVAQHVFEFSATHGRL